MAMVNVVTIAALGGSIGSGWSAWSKGRRPHGAVCCIHQMNRVNSHSSSATMTSSWTLSWLLLLLLLRVWLNGLGVVRGDQLQQLTSAATQHDTTLYGPIIAINGV